MTAPEGRPAGEATEPPDEQQAAQAAAATPVTLPGTAARSMLDTLRHVDEFLRQAGPATRAELRTFCAARGWSPAGGAGVLIDSIGLHALTLHRAITSATTDTVSIHDKEPA